MILIELIGGETRRFRLEFHPRVTVVVGLTLQQRKELAASLTAAMGGTDVGMSITVDVGGDPQPLTPDLVARLGLARVPLDNVIEPIDLPGVVPVGDVQDVESAAAVSRRSANPPVIDAGTPLAVARQAFQQAQARVEELAERIDAARRGVQPADPAALEQATWSMERAASRVAELRSAIEEIEPTVATKEAATPEQKLARLRKRQHDLEQKVSRAKTALGHLDIAVDLEAFWELLEAARQAAADEAVLAGSGVDAPGELADDWVELVGRRRRAAALPPQPTWLVDQVRTDLEASRSEVLVLEAKEADGMDVHAHLERARRDLAAAQENWDELYPDGLDVEVIDAAIDELYERAVVVLGHDPGPDALERALRSEQRRRDELDDPRVELIDVLERFGIRAELHDVVDRAEAWLEVRVSDEERVEAYQRELAAAVLDLEQAKARVVELAREIDHPLVDIETPYDETLARLAALRKELDEALQFQREAQDYVEELHRGVESEEPIDLAQLERQHRDAIGAMEAAGRKVDYFAQLAMLAGNHAAEASDDALSMSDDAPSPSPASVPAGAGAGAGVGAGNVGDAPRPWWEGGNVTVQPRVMPISAEVDVDTDAVNGDDAETYLLARAAGLRRLGRGESVPLIIDAAFDRLPGEVTARLFDILPRISPIVPIVYLAGSDVAERWAKRQDEMVVATCRLEWA